MPLHRFFLKGWFCLCSAALAQGAVFEGWQEIFPGGNTSCARGGAFSFFVKLGEDPSFFVVDFFGGGACWNGELCAEDGPFFDDVADTKQRIAEDGGLHGVYDSKNPLNPLRKATHLAIPSCTGDAHMGDRVTRYESLKGEPLDIQHRGAPNVKAALQWAQQHLSKSFKTVLVTGCSAGAYGSIYWLPYLQRMYSEARLLQFGDSGAGLATDEFFETIQQFWNIEGALSSWVFQGDVPRPVTIFQLYQQIGTVSTVPLAQFNNRRDGVQMLYYEATGGDAAQWSEELIVQQQKLAQDNPRFQSLIGDSDDHCVLISDAIYSQKDQNGRVIRDWLNSYVTSDP